MTTLLLVGPLLYLHRRARVPAGTAAVLVTAIATVPGASSAVGRTPPVHVLARLLQPHVVFEVRVPRSPAAPPIPDEESLMNRMNRQQRRAAARTPEGRAARERQRHIDRQLRVWTPRRIFGWTLAAVAVVVAVVHWTAHVGYRPIPLSMGAQDLLLGYPAAALLGVAAAIILGQTTTRHR